MFSISVLSFIVLTLDLVAGLPASLTSTEESLYVRDNKLQVSRDTTPDACSPLDLDDAQSLPGWGQLEQYARSTWGEGDWTITINPPNYKDKLATLCVADSIPVIMTGEPNCNYTRVDIPPEKHSNKVKVDEGYTNIGNWNITNATVAAHAELFKATFQMPNITSQKLYGLKGTGQFINAPFNSFVTVATNKTIVTTNLTPVPDKHCIGTIRNEQCITPARGRIQLVATGYIWFKYKTKRAPLANPTGGKHSRYVVKIEDVLKNATDRSTWIDFNGYMNTTMRYDYFDECRWNFRL